MKRILVVSGSRADYGLLEWPMKVMVETFGPILRIDLWNKTFEQAFDITSRKLQESPPDVMVILGDRFEILAAATAAHLQRIPIAHIGGGDVTEGSYDDAMRDAISRFASIHFVTSTSALARLSGMGFRNIHLVGNPGIDFIRHADWKRERPIESPYVVVSYQPETLDGTNDLVKLCADLPVNKHWVMIGPNPDRGSDEIRDFMRALAKEREGCTYHDYLPHAEFLNMLAHCDEFIGNSSSMLYEAPELGIKTRMIGKRQKGRTIPWGDGNASKRIVNILRYTIP